MSDIEFIGGLVIKPPREGAPEFVKFKGSIKREEMLAYCAANTDEWINFDVKESKGGKLYAARDTWKPESKGDRPQRQESRGGGGSSPPSGGDEPFPDDSIPFATCYGDF